MIKRLNYIYDEIHELTIKDIIMFITVMIFVINFSIINRLGYKNIMIVSLKKLF